MNWMQIMKATGIVRRIDDLGRVAIRVELRRNMGISDRDPLEIFTDNDGNIILKKYDPLPEIVKHVKTLQEMINDNMNYEPEVTKKRQAYYQNLKIL